MATATATAFTSVAVGGATRLTRASAGPAHSSLVLFLPPLPPPRRQGLPSSLLPGYYGGGAQKRGSSGQVPPVSKLGTFNRPGREPGWED